LNPTAREAMFGYLAAHRPHLVPAYESLFPTKYVPKAVAKSYERTIDAALATAPIPERTTIIPEPSRVQLSLL
jgi:hypothetical protein